MPSASHLPFSKPSSKLAAGPRVVALLLFFLLALWFILSPSLMSAFSGLGGYISEKSLGDGVGRTLHLGDGASQLMVLGSGPVVATLPVTNNMTVGTPTATFNGTLSSLNGMPRADVWFEWGYAPSALANTTPVVVTMATGAMSATVSGLSAGSTVYYRMAASTDGTSRGGVTDFLAGGGHGASYWLMRDMLPLLIALVIFVAVLSLSGNPLVALAGALIGLLAVYVVQAILGIL